MGIFPQLQGQWHAILRDIKDSFPIPAGESRELKHLSMQILRAGLRDHQFYSVGEGDRRKDSQTYSSAQKHTHKKKKNIITIEE